MDPSRFDAISRAFSVRHSRRGVSRLAGGLTAGALLTALGVRDGAAGSRPGGSPCTKDHQCLTRRCFGPKGQRRCGCSQKFPTCTTGFCIKRKCAPCQRCYVPDGNGGCTRVQDPMNGRCPCGFEERPDGFCYKDNCEDCFENVGGVCVPESPGTAPNGPCDCGFTDVGGICVPRYPLP